MKIYSLKSVSLGHLNKPFYADGDLEAINELRNAVKFGGESPLKANIDDLELHCIGEFSSEKGIVSTKAKFVISLKDIPLIDEIYKEACDVETV